MKSNQRIFTPPILNCICGLPAKLYNNDLFFNSQDNKFKVECTGICKSNLGYNITANRAIHKWNNYIKKCKQELQAGREMYLKSKGDL